MALHSNVLMYIILQDSEASCFSVQYRRYLARSYVDSHGIALS